MHGGSCISRISGIHCIGIIMQHRPSTAAVDTIIGNIAATKAVTRAAVRGTAAVIVVQITSIDATMIKETDTGAMMWAKLLVAIIVLLMKLQTGVGGSTTPRRTRTTSISGSHEVGSAIIVHCRQRDRRALYV